MIKTIGVLVLFAFTINVFGQSSEFTKTLPPKDPGKALIYSLVPGGGQLHNDQIVLGLSILTAESLLFYIGNSMTNSGDYEQSSIDAVYGFAGAIYAIQLIHAPIVSHLKNLKSGHSRKNNFKSGVWVSLTPYNEKMFIIGYRF